MRKITIFTLLTLKEILQPGVDPIVLQSIAILLLNYRNTFIFCNKLQYLDILQHLFQFIIRREKILQMKISWHIRKKKEKFFQYRSRKLSIMILSFNISFLLRNKNTYVSRITILEYLLWRLLKVFLKNMWSLFHDLYLYI